MIGDHAGQYKENTEKGIFLAKGVKDKVQKHCPSVKLAFRVSTKNY